MSNAVLIAEDDTLIAELIVHQLDREGFETVLIEDGTRVHPSAVDLQPTAIILDGMLPGLDGFKVLRDLKEDDRTKGIPVLMLTARIKEEDVLEGLSLGAEDYITKPFMPKELLVRLKRIIARDQ